MHARVSMTAFFSASTFARSRSSLFARLRSRCSDSMSSSWTAAAAAALFLGEFVSRDTPWAHLDIAGPAFTDSVTETGTIR